MRNTTIIALIVLTGAVAGTVYLKNRPETGARTPLEASTAEPVTAPPEVSADDESFESSPFAEDDPQLGWAQPDDAGYDTPDSSPTPAPYDPRLAALEVTPDNGWINYVTGSDGKVTMEIDMDPASPGYKKPMRKYTYAGDRVTELIAYRYFHDHVQITTTTVSYNPDGSIAEYAESTSYDYGDEAGDGT